MNIVVITIIVFEYIKFQLWFTSKSVFILIMYGKIASKLPLWLQQFSNLELQAYGECVVLKPV